MKKTVILLICLIFLCGCGKKDVSLPVESPKPSIEVPEEKVPEYVDSNTTPIGIYSLSGNKLTRLDKINTNLVVEQDIGVFQIFPSNEDVVYLDKSFGQAFYDEWMKYNPNKTIKIGFNIKFTKNTGEQISYNIFNPSQTFDHWEQLMNYLYDDYANLGKGFYSHIENEEFNENTLLTSFKMQSSYQCDEISSKIMLSVFTYDSEDDFLENKEYRGNSSHTLNICVNGLGC